MPSGPKDMPDTARIVNVVAAVGTEVLCTFYGSPSGDSGFSVKESQMAHTLTGVLATLNDVQRELIDWFAGSRALLPHLGCLT